VKVAVVVPCRNEAAHISGLLDALAGQTRVPDEILIVDDESTDDTADLVRAWQVVHPTPLVRLIDGPGQGPGPAMNAGIRATDADVIMRMDGHAVPSWDYLERSLDALAPGLKPWVSTDKPRASSNLQIGVVGGIWRVVPGADTPVARAIAAVVSHPLGSGGAGYRSPRAQGPERTSVETVPFGTFPRTVWERIGGFDESLAANEDFDFNYRARRAGFEVVLDRRISATYFSRPTLRTLARQYFRYGFWKLQMLRKDPRAIHPRQLPPAMVLPWILTTCGAMVLVPGLFTGSVALVYPLIVLSGGLIVAVGRRVSPLAASAAIATVHVAWSAGFWAGVTQGASRRPSRSGT